MILMRRGKKLIKFNEKLETQCYLPEKYVIFININDINEKGKNPIKNIMKN